MYYAETTMHDGTFPHTVLHIFGSEFDRNGWVASEPDEPGYGEMWEMAGRREAVTAANARPGAMYLDGIDLHGVRESDLPIWAYDAVNSGMMSVQQRDERHPDVVSYWTVVSCH